MLDNKYCKVEDFLLDDSFVEWVLGNSAEQDSYWENFLSKRPECEENLKQASSIILAFKIKPVSDLSSQQIDALIAGVMARHSQVADERVIILPKRRPLFKTILKYAAILSFVVSVGAGGYILYKNKFAATAQKAYLQAYQQVINQRTLPMLVKLPDHSSVVLKPGAQLRYPNIFTGNKREVSLSGEAFFEVAKNRVKPFFVYSNELTVRVVGTSFVVKAIKGDNQFKIIVSTGRVEVFTHNKDAGEHRAIVLTPNQQAVLYRSEVRLEKAVRLRLICKAVEAEYKIVDGHIVIDGPGCN